ncbi:hypothetical protein NQ314_009994 [Rhamnusium bicolor]|uniref:Uncharacterized protein n=1 Tax=Rhamnusium bicolor TaxID=1586634 RepID=A0AAV8XWM6_9CUCU|nr:hypothetical protein NQ314_009994 [Rhamnusium bicolor]
MILKKQYNYLLTTAKQSYYQNRLNEIDNYSKTVWDIINLETERVNKSNTYPETLSADNLNHFFLNNAETIVQNLQTHGINDVNSYMDKKITKHHSMFFMPLTPDDIRIIIGNI